MANAATLPPNGGRFVVFFLLLSEGHSMRHATSILASALLGFCLAGERTNAAMVQLSSPDQISGNPSTINFEGYSAYTVANSLYQNQGIALSRDDGDSIFIHDWSALGRSTTSPRYVLATISGRGVLTWATSLNISSASPLMAAGAYFGNDQPLLSIPENDLYTMRLSAYDMSDQFVGSVTVSVNHNTSVDQFIGIRSDVPFSRVRFDNLNDTGGPALKYAVVIDDLVFASVPEPASLCLLGLGALISLRSRKARGRAK